MSRENLQRRTIEDSGHIVTVIKVTWDEFVSGAAFTPDRQSIAKRADFIAVVDRGL
jgi:hypothetical protein